jgi:hypothetical protein
LTTLGVTLIAFTALLGVVDEVDDEEEDEEEG